VRPSSIRSGDLDEGLNQSDNSFIKDTPYNNSKHRSREAHNLSESKMAEYPVIYRTRKNKTKLEIPSMRSNLSKMLEE